jgi:uncharacterized protein (DUF983 family)
MTERSDSMSSDRPLSSKDAVSFIQPSPYQSGLKGTCPRCGQASMFTGVLALKQHCPVCDLDYDFADSADGPAIFVMLIVGFIITGLALWLELVYEPPFWVHALLWAPLTLVLSIATLRPIKGLLVSLQYVHNAREGALNSSDDAPHA